MLRVMGMVLLLTAFSGPWFLHASAQTPVLQVAETREIHSSTEHMWSLSWSPDGRSLAYSRHPHGERFPAAHIWVVDSTGGNARQLTRTSTGTYNWHPSYNVDGTQIVFYRCSQDQCTLAIMSGDGSAERTLPAPGLSARSPTWSPDGKRILFIGYKGSNPDVYVMNSDGSGLTPLIATPDDETRAQFSPDGRRLLYVASGQLRIADADGQNGRLVTLGPRDTDPRFSPDGQWIVYASRKRESFSYLRAINTADALAGLVDDKQHVLLTSGENIWDYFPAFSPDSRRLAFLRQHRVGGTWQRGTLWTATLR